MVVVEWSMLLLLDQYFNQLLRSTPPAQGQAFRIWAYFAKLIS
jgi:hypothetical protein